MANPSNMTSKETYILIKPILSIGHEFTHHAHIDTQSSDVYECIVGLGKDHTGTLLVDGEFVRENPSYFTAYNPNLPLEQ